MNLSRPSSSSASPFTSGIIAKEHIADCFRCFFLFVFVYLLCGVDGQSLLRPCRSAVHFLRRQSLLEICSQTVRQPPLWRSSSLPTNSSRSPPCTILISRHYIPVPSRHPFLQDFFLEIFKFDISRTVLFEIVALYRGTLEHWTTALMANNITCASGIGPFLSE